MKLHTLAPHESRMCPIEFGVKGQGNGALMIENGFRSITDFVIHLNFVIHLKTSYTCSPWVKNVPYWFWGQKVKVMGHWWLIMILRVITDSVIHLSSWNFIHLLPMSQGMCPIDFRGISDWEWFSEHNCLCNPPMIMKLHSLAPHESRMCPIDSGVKSWNVNVMGHLWLKTVSGP